MLQIVHLAEQVILLLSVQQRDIVQRSQVRWQSAWCTHFTSRISRDREISRHFIDAGLIVKFCIRHEIQRQFEDLDCALLVQNPNDTASDSPVAFCKNDRGDTAVVLLVHGASVLI